MWLSNSALIRLTSYSSFKSIINHVGSTPVGKPFVCVTMEFTGLNVSEVSFPRLFSIFVNTAASPLLVKPSTRATGALPNTSASAVTSFPSDIPPGISVSFEICCEHDPNSKHRAAIKPSRCHHTTARVCFSLLPFILFFPP